MDPRAPEPEPAWTPPILGSAAVFAALLFAGTVLWLKFGDGVYVERILGAIAGCF
ncbi:hypothetical protein [Lutibaculum baratangense]|nr:hypothetical protein [Lutibaculum baratangense]